MQSTQWILLIVSVFRFHRTLSLSSHDEIPENECVRETLNFNSGPVELAIAVLGLGQCACRFSCPNLSEYVEFYIYNPGSNDFQQLFSNGSNANLIDHNKSTTLFVHGYVDYFQPIQKHWINDLCRMESKILNRNTIALNYRKITRCTYFSAEGFVPKIGDTIHRMLNDVFKINLRQVHCVGHSLGAHICGSAGTASGGQFERCFGLDPALLFPLVTNFGTALTLNANSCQYVQAIHTMKILYLGKLETKGRIDFHTNTVNGYQPHCKSQEIGCSHKAAVEYYKASLDPNNEFLGQSCKRSKSDSKKMNCKFGPHNKDNCTGDACFETSPCAPYVISNL